MGSKQGGDPWRVLLNTGQRTEQINTLLSKLQTLEAAHKQSQTSTLTTELDTVRAQITELLTFQISRKK